MLNFSKINIITIYFVFFIVSIFSFLNFQNENNPIVDKKVNLGLDLQGGSYLLLEINSDSLVEEKIQSKVIPIKKLLKENDIKFNNFKINNSSLKFKPKLVAFMTISNLLMLFEKSSHLIMFKFLNFFFRNKDFSKVLLLKEISCIFDFNKASIIEGATPPAPKIKTFLLSV